mmetsp:Transcript_17007/g.26237  ORF Transcript_17007/g.26237 Transcript_17007/m.26237 type:complete len:123 (-) Transcript_17007:234-602(-)
MLHGLTLLSWGVMGILGCCFIVFLIDRRNLAGGRVAASNKLLKELESKKAHHKWSEKLRTELDFREENELECPICLAEFINGDKLVILKCHRNHKFHSDCLLQFLKNVNLNLVGEAKCPMCK